MLTLQPSFYSAGSSHCLGLLQLISTAFNSLQQHSLLLPLLFHTLVLHHANSLYCSLLLLFLCIPCLCPLVSSFSLALWLPLSADSTASLILAYPVSYLLACLLLRLPEFTFPLSHRLLLQLPTFGFICLSKTPIFTGHV